MALWTPSDATVTPSLWLDASDSATMFNATSGGSTISVGSGIARWEDKSGNGRHFIQATAGNRPIRAAGLIATGLTVARFDGVDDWLIADTTALNLLNGVGYAEVLIAYTSGAANRLMDASNGQVLLGFSINGGTGSRFLAVDTNFAASTTFSIRRFGGRTSDGGSFSEVTLVDTYRMDHHLFGGISDYAGGGITLRMDGSQVSTGTHASPSTQSATNSTYAAIATLPSTSPQHAFRGLICEIIVLLTEPTAAEREEYEGYLMHKWGFEGNLPLTHPYRDLAPGETASSGGGAILHPLAYTGQR